MPPIGGGLLQLVAMDAQDIYLRSNKYIRNPKSLTDILIGQLNYTQEEFILLKKQQYPILFDKVMKRIKSYKRSNRRMNKIYWEITRNYSKYNKLTSCIKNNKKKFINGDEIIERHEIDSEWDTEISKSLRKKQLLLQRNKIKVERSFKNFDVDDDLDLSDLFF